MKHQETVNMNEDLTIEETGEGHDGLVPVDVRLVLLGMSDAVINEHGLVGLP